MHLTITSTNPLPSPPYSAAVAPVAEAPVENKPTLLSLSTEIHKEIFSYLSGEDFKQISLVCSQFRNTKNHFLVKRLKASKFEDLKI